MAAPALPSWIESEGCTITVALSAIPLITAVQVPSEAPMSTVTVQTTGRIWVARGAVQVSFLDRGPVAKGA